MSQRKLRLFRRNQAIQHGHFLLSSGNHSPLYIQCTRILQYPWYGRELGKELGERAREEFGDIHAVASPALGGILIGYEVAHALQVPFIFAERVNGQMRFRRGQYVHTGKRYLIVEDVVTTGGSIREVQELIEHEQGIVVGFATIIDRRTKPDTSFPLISLLQLHLPVYPPSECPLCEQHIPLVSPGSKHSSR